jgi:hypothetical protein
MFDVPILFIIGERTTRRFFLPIATTQSVINCSNDRDPTYESGSRMSRSLKLVV